MKLPIALLALAALLGCDSASAPNPDNRSPAAEPSPRANQASDASPSEGSSRPRSRHNHSAANAAPGDFDFYLLNLSWSPEFCATHATSPECSAHPGFVVHGLWPQNTDGTYPENCSNAPGPANPGQYTDIIPTASLVEHEWATHGTCSGLDANAYFSTIRSAFHSIHIPAAFTSTQAPPSMLAPDVILAQFSRANPTFLAASFSMSCGNNYLTAVEVCLDKGLHPVPCAGVRSCRANQVKITPR